MPKLRQVKDLETVKSHLSEEEKFQRKDMQASMFAYPELNVTPPGWLHGSAITEWNRVVPYLKANTPISELDRSLLATYCEDYRLIQAAEADLKKHGIVQTGKTGVRKKNPYVDVLSTATKDLKSLANDLGMSIGSRARMELNKAKTKETPKDKFEEAMK